MWNSSYGGQICITSLRTPPEGALPLPAHIETPPALCQPTQPPTARPPPLLPNQPLCIATKRPCSPFPVALKVIPRRLPPHDLSVHYRRLSLSLSLSLFDYSKWCERRCWRVASVAFEKMDQFPRFEVLRMVVPFTRNLKINVGDNFRFCIFFFLFTRDRSLGFILHKTIVNACCSFWCLRHNAFL